MRNLALIALVSMFIIAGCDTPPSYGDWSSQCSVMNGSDTVNYYWMHRSGRDFLIIMVKRPNGKYITYSSRYSRVPNQATHLNFALTQIMVFVPWKDAEKYDGEFITDKMRQDHSALLSIYGDAKSAVSVMKTKIYDDAVAPTKTETSSN